MGVPAHVIDSPPAVPALGTRPIATDRLDWLSAAIYLHGGAAYGLASHVLGRATGADDVVEGAFLRIMGRSPHTVPIASLRVPLLQAVIELAVEALRQAQSRSAPPNADASPATEFGDAAGFHPREAGPTGSSSSYGTPGRGGPDFSG